MKKRIYIQPEMDMAVMPKYAVMVWQNSPGEEFNPPTSAPKKNPLDLF